MKYQSLDADFKSFPEMNQIAVLDNVISQVEEQQKFILLYIKEHRSQNFNIAMHEFAIACVEKYGPIFSSEQVDTINVFGLCGSIAQEIVLISLLFSAE